jgi:hypothetical protein
MPPAGVPSANSVRVKFAAARISALEPAAAALSSARQVCATGHAGNAPTAYG